MHHAALSSSFGKQLGSRFYQPSARVGDDQLHPSQAAIFEVAQEPAPALQIFLLALGYPQNLPVTVGADADRRWSYAETIRSGGAAAEGRSQAMVVAARMRPMAVSTRTASSKASTTIRIRHFE